MINRKNFVAIISALMAVASGYATIIMLLFGFGTAALVFLGLTIAYFGMALTTDKNQ